MSTPAIIAVSIVLVSLALNIARIWRIRREWLLWLERDKAMTQAFHDCITRCDFDEAREIRQELKRNFDKVFTSKP